MFPRNFLNFFVPNHAFFRGETTTAQIFAVPRAICSQKARTQRLNVRKYTVPPSSMAAAVKMRTSPPVARWDQKNSTMAAPAQNPPSSRPVTPPFRILPRSMCRKSYTTPAPPPIKIAPQAAVSCSSMEMPMAVYRNHRRNSPPPLSPSDS